MICWETGTGAAEGVTVSVSWSDFTLKCSLSSASYPVVLLSPAHLSPKKVLAGKVIVTREAWCGEGVTGLAGCGRRCGTCMIQVAGRLDMLGNRDWSC